MKALSLFALVAAVFAAVPAQAQQTQTLTTCTILFDAGTSGDGGTTACPATFTNFSPVVGECTIGTVGFQTNAGNIEVFVGPTATALGYPVDAGGGPFFIPFVQSGTDGGVAQKFAFSISPYNPWSYMDVVFAGSITDAGAGIPGSIGDGGTGENGYATCTFGVLQSQTIHLSVPRIPTKTKVKEAR